MKWLENILKDKILMRNIRSVAIGILALSLGIVYTGLFNSANLKSLFTIKVAGLSIIAMVSVRIWRFDIKTRAFEDERDENVKIKEIEDEFEKLSTQEIDFESCIDYIEKWNIKEQENANRIKTSNYIANLKRKRDKKLIRYSYNSNKYKQLKEKFQDKIDKAKATPKFDKRFKPVTLKQMLSGYTIKSKKEEVGKLRFEYNPVLAGEKKSLFFSIFKFFGIGASGSLVFNSIDNPIAIVLYYLFLIISMTLTVVIQYPKTKERTGTEYLSKRIEKVVFLRKMLSHKKQEQKLLNAPLNGINTQIDN